MGSIKNCLLYTSYTQFQEGFDAMNSGKSGKVILDWTGESGE